MITGSDATYKLVGANADLFKGNTSTLIGMHFFNEAGQPTFTQIDGSGNEVGSVVGKPMGSVKPPSKSDDGGFGSVPDLLLSASEGTGNTKCPLLQVLRI